MFRRIVGVAIAVAGCDVNLEEAEGAFTLRIGEAECTAAWISHRRADMLEAALKEKDFVFTDDLDKVPFGASSGRLFFLEGLGSEVNERPMPRQAM
eukprot:symbB.v1.2.020550.t1/scaffold1731.1/size134469/7